MPKARLWYITTLPPRIFKFNNKKDRFSIDGIYLCSKLYYEKELWTPGTGVVFLWEKRIERARRNSPCAF